MKRLSLFVMLLVTGAMLLAACGGGGGGASSGSSTGTLKGGESGIKDTALIGKWISADGGSSYDFKDDYTVSATIVGGSYTTQYNITEGGKGSGKVQIGESDGKVTTWDYKIDQDRIELNTPDGRARRMRKS
jgi:hypothetical protein